MKPNPILKKRIQLFLQAPTDVAAYEKEKLEDIASSPDKESVIDELTFEIGKTLLAPANRLILTNDASAGWTAFERAMVWLFHYIDKSNPTNFSLTDEPFAAVIGMSWLFENKEITNNAITLLRRRWALKKEDAHRYVQHKELLVSLYEMNYYPDHRSRPVDLLPDNHIYRRLIDGIAISNDQYLPLLQEACDYHLLHTPLAANRNVIEFSFFELVPYEILLVLRTRAKLGFIIPVVEHALMNTALARFKRSYSTYAAEQDLVLQSVLEKVG